MRPNSKVQVVTLCQQFLLQTNGSTLNQFIWFDRPEVEDLGPYIQEIQAHVLTPFRTANNAWEIYVTWSADRKKWKTPIQIGTTVTSAGSQVLDAYDATLAANRLGLYLRFGLATRNLSGTNAELAYANAALALRFWT